MTNQDRSAISPDALERLERLIEMKPGLLAIGLSSHMDDIWADIAQLLSERKALRETLEPFACVARLMVPLVEQDPSRWPDDRPNGEFIPSEWPRWGDFRRAASILGEPK